MWQFIEKLRQKTDHEKQRIAFGLSLGITFLIVLVWISTIALDTGSVTANTQSPFQGLKDSFSEMWNQNPLTAPSN